MASKTFCGICAPAALSKNTELPLRFNAGNIRRRWSTGNSAITVLSHHSSSSLAGTKLCASMNYARAAKYTPQGLNGRLRHLKVLACVHRSRAGRQEVEISFEQLEHAFNVALRVVNMERKAQAIVTIGADNARGSQLLNERGSVLALQHAERPNAIGGSFCAKPQFPPAREESTHQPRNMRGNVFEANLLEQLNRPHCRVNVGDGRRTCFKAARRGSKVEMFHIEGKGVGLREPSGDCRMQRLNQLFPYIQKCQARRPQKILQCSGHVEIDIYHPHIHGASAAVLIIVQHRQSSICVRELHNLLY